MIKKKLFKTVITLKKAKQKKIIHEVYFPTN
jgi:hypothetical protein